MNGNNGSNGKDGLNGKNGLDGKDGKDGLNGTNGLDGKDGKDGQDFYRNWKECAWMNVNDDKDKGLIKVKFLFQFLIVISGNENAIHAFFIKKNTLQE